MTIQLKIHFSVSLVSNCSDPVTAIIGWRKRRKKGETVSDYWQVKTKLYILKMKTFGVSEKNWLPATNACCLKSNSVIRRNIFQKATEVSHCVFVNEAACSLVETNTCEILPFCHVCHHFSDGIYVQGQFSIAFDALLVHLVPSLPACDIQRGLWKGQRSNAVSILKTNLRHEALA